MCFRCPMQVANFLLRMKNQEVRGGPAASVSVFWKAAVRRRHQHENTQPAVELMSCRARLGRNSCKFKEVACLLLFPFITIALGANWRAQRHQPRGCRGLIYDAQCRSRFSLWKGGNGQPEKTDKKLIQREQAVKQANKDNAVRAELDCRDCAYVRFSCLSTCAGSIIGYLCS